MSVLAAAARLRTGDPAPPPPPVRSESEVTAHWSGDRPIVSVVCPTYQHGGFIEDAIRGFLGQTTDFPFEVLIRDDASTDGTADVVRDYSQRYPNVIRAVLETKNRYPDVRAGAVLGPLMRGDFVAVCEGDDYWTDPRKLQVQHDGLLEHPEAVASHHPVSVVRDGRVERPEKRTRRHCRDFTADELARGARIISCSVMRRNVALLEARTGSLHVDMWTRARLGLHGGARWEASVAPAVHRLHLGGVWSTRSERDRVWIQQQYFVRFAEEFRLNGQQELSDHYRRAALALGVYGRLAATHPVVGRLMATLRSRAWGA